MESVTRVQVLVSLNQCRAYRQYNFYRSGVPEPRQTCMRTIDRPGSFKRDYKREAKVAPSSGGQAQACCNYKI